MKSYISKEWFEPDIHYVIRDDGTLTDGKRIFPLSAFNPIPERYRHQTPGQLLVLFAGVLLISIALLLRLPPVFALTGGILLVLLLLGMLFRNRCTCRFQAFSGGAPLLIRLGAENFREGEHFIVSLQKIMAKEFQVPKTVYRNRDSFLAELETMRTDYLLSEVEIQILAAQYDTLPFTAPHTFVILDVLRMEGILSEEEFQEIKFERIFHPKP